MIKRLWLFAALLLLVIFTGAMLNIAWPYFSFRYDVAFLLTKQTVLHHAAWRWAFYLHISSSVLVLFAGGLQFVKYIQDRYPALHRFLGKVYVFTLLAISAPSGLIMAFYANGGVWTRVSFVLISLLWWLFTYKAFMQIRMRNIPAHQQYMLRSYALTLSAITLRLYVMILPVFVHLHAKEMYVLVSWLSWVPNLMVAELLIRLQKKKNCNSGVISA